MQIKKGVTGVVFRFVNDKPIFLLLHRVLNWQGFEFPKGGVEFGEAHDKAVLREISEETGLKDAVIVCQLASGIEWLKKENKYVYDGFLVQAFSKDVSLHQEVMEHDDFKWVNAGEAKKLLTHKENKMLLAKAVKFLKSNPFKQVHLVLSGRVQGVFFRAFVQKAAREIGGITGHVKNLPAGEVGILAEGPKKNLVEFVKKAKKGPALSKVEKATVEWGKPSHSFARFEIVR